MPFLQPINGFEVLVVGRGYSDKVQLGTDDAKRHLFILADDVQVCVRSIQLKHWVCTFTDDTLLST